MTLKERITEDMKAAMRARDGARLSAIRLLLAAMKQKEVDERIELDDAAVTAIIEKLLKQRKDSASQYEAAQRIDLANQERFEIGVLMAYMPQPFSAEEVAALVNAGRDRDRRRRGQGHGQGHGLAEAETGRPRPT
jgi:uncharacterized protein YqeY